MPMEQEPSPEEILLRLIKGGKSSKGSGPKSQEPVGDVTPSPASEPTAARPAPSNVKQRASRAIGWNSFAEKFYADLHLLPRVFLFLSLALALFIVVQIVGDSLQSKRKLERLWKAGSRAELALQRPANPVASQTAAGALPDKDLFKIVDSPGPTLDRALGPRVASLDQILSNYVLSGIVGGDKPQAVIEDKRQGKTYFVSVGDTIGEIRIVKIEEGRVTVAIGDQQAQLEL